MTDQRGTLTRLRRFPRAVRVLVLGTLVNSVGLMISPYLTLVLTQKLNMTALTVGRTVAAYGVGALIAILVGGHLTDKIGRRRTLMTSMFGTGTIAVLTPLVGGHSAMLPVVVFVLGAFTELYRPASAAILADALPSGDRALGVSASRVALNLGAFIGLSLGGVLFDCDWRWLFWFDGATSIAFGVFAAALLVEPQRPTTPTDGAPGSPAEAPAGSILPFALALVANLLWVLVYVAHNTVLPLSISQQGAYSGRVIGALMAINAFLVVSCELFIINGLSRLRRLRVAALGCVLMGVGLGLSGAVRHWMWYAGTIVLWSLGEILSLSPIASFIMDCAPVHRRGRYIGLHSLTWRVGYVVGPVLFLGLFNRLPVSVFWLIMPAIALPTSPILAFLDGEFERDRMVAI